MAIGLDFAVTGAEKEYMRETDFIMQSPVPWNDFIAALTNFKSVEVRE